MNVVIVFVAVCVFGLWPGSFGSVGERDGLFGPRPAAAQPRGPGGGGGGGGGDPCMQSYQRCVALCGGAGNCVNNCNLGYASCQQQQGRGGQQGQPQGQGGRQPGQQQGQPQGQPQGQGGRQPGQQQGMPPQGQQGMPQGQQGGGGGNQCMQSYQRCVALCGGAGNCVNNCNLGYASCQQGGGRRP